jgi:tricarballylate dehydrogenase
MHNVYRRVQWCVVQSYDVIVAGGGNAGLCAAMAARDVGARVLLLERSPDWRRGGNSRHTRDIRYAHEQPDEWATTAYPPAEFFADLEAVAGTLPNRRLAELLVDRSQDLPAWMEARGCRWQRPMHGTLHLHTNRFFLGGGKAMINSYYETARAVGIDVRTDTRVEALELDDGRCTGVRFRNGGATERAAARAVVVSSGGLEANHEWLASTWGDGAHNFIVRGTPDNDGDLLLSLLEAGAAPGGSSLFHGVAVDARAPRYDGGIVTRIDSIPFGIVVNRDARRFYDEGEAPWPKRYAEWGRMIARQPGQIAYSIFDQQSVDLFIPSLFPPVQSATIAGLAVELGLDAQALLATVDEYNAAVDDTLPFDHSHLDGRRAHGLEPPRSNWARRIDRPPYLGYPLRPGLTFTYAGVEIDETARVGRTSGGTFENVFAAGEVMAGNVLSRGYLAGVGLTIGSVFGRIAGSEAARA